MTLITRIALCLILSIVTISNAQNKKKRPNILFAFADDWGKYASCYGKEKDSEPWQNSLNTPNIDRIASEGVLFNNAFVNAPSCTPSRSAILSGQHFYRTGRGAILSGAVWDMNIPTYPLLLKKSGYHIGFVYKVWAPGTERDAGYGGKTNKYQKAGTKFCLFSQNTSKLMKEGKSLNQAKETLYQEVRENFSNFLDANEEGKPFCYWFGPTNTHRKFEKGSGKDQWGIDPDDLKGKLPSFLPDVPVVRQDFSDYLGEVQAFDAGLGELLKMLEERGELDNTLVVVSGDHGIPGFTNGKCNLYDFGTEVVLAARWPSVIKPNRVVDDFVNLMDLAPTFLEVGGVDIPEIMTANSLLPVFKSSKRKGTVDKKRDHVITGRERHVGGAREGRLPYPQRAIRTKDYLYIINFEPSRSPMGKPLTDEKRATITFDILANKTGACFADFDCSPTKAWIVENKDVSGNEKYYEYAFGYRPGEELYKIDNDPFQINNLAENKSYSKVKAKLRQRLLSELKTTLDPRVTGDGTTFDKAPYAGEEEKKKGPKKKGSKKKKKKKVKK